MLALAEDRPDLLEPVGRRGSPTSAPRSSTPRARRWPARSTTCWPGGPGPRSSGRRPPSDAAPARGRPRGRRARLGRRPPCADQVGRLRRDARHAGARLTAGRRAPSEPRRRRAHAAIDADARRGHRAPTRRTPAAVTPPVPSTALDAAGADWSTDDAARAEAGRRLVAARHRLGGHGRRCRPRPAIVVRPHSTAEVAARAGRAATRRASRSPPTAGRSGRVRRLDPGVRRGRRST